MKTSSTGKQFTFLCLMILLFASSKNFAQNYEVSGAGTASANGIYVNDGTYNGKPHYTKSGSPNYYMYYSSYWLISQTDNSTQSNSYYFNFGSDSTPPTSSWYTRNGSSPSPTVAIAVPKLTYSVSTLIESTSNNGSIDNSTPMTITHNNYNAGTFTGSDGDNFLVQGKVTVANLPSGLTAVITRTSSTVLSVTITGNASSHNNVDDVNNLTFTFQNSAFSTNDASSITNSTKSDLSVNFIQQLEVPSEYSTIASAVSSAGNGDVINIAAGTYTEANLSSSNKSLHFVGQGPSSTIIQPSSSYNSASSRVFYCSFGSYSSLNTITFEKLTLRYGKVTTGSPARGGALYTRYANVVVTNCEISSNLTNDGVDAWGGGGGGGIHVLEGNLTVNNSTFENNSSSMRTSSDDAAGGGAIYFYTGSISGFTLTVTNCTFSGNTAAQKGGAIFLYPSSSATSIITNCTFSNNTAMYGGAFYSTNATNQSLTFQNSIFYNNTGTTAGRDIYSGASITGTFVTCLLQSLSIGNLSGLDSYTNNNAGTNPLISTLADNGSFTRTMSLQSGSPAIDAGTSSGAPSTDQRGYSRTGSIDIGAFEYNASPLPVELTSFSCSENEGQVVLSWQTATEVNNYGFDVERKAENESWSKISFVQGHGNSNSPKNYSFTDSSPLAGKIQYRLKQIDFDGKFEYSPIIDVNVDAPVSFALHQNHPNPFNPETIISFQLPFAELVSLKVFDVLGKEVAELVNEQKPSGNYEVNFNGSNLASGIYFYQLRSGRFVQTKKFILMK